MIKISLKKLSTFEVLQRESKNDFAGNKDKNDFFGPDPK